MYLFSYSDGLRKELFTTDNVHDGNTALTIDKDVCVFRYRHPDKISAIATIWMYDNPNKKDAEAFVFVQNGDPSVYPFYMNPKLRRGHRGRATPEMRFGWMSSPDEIFAALGTYGKVSTEKYVICVNGETTTTQIRRKAGWHEVTFEVNAEKGCVISMDGNVVGTAPTLKQFNIVDAGDREFGSDSKGIGFDNFSIK